MVEGEGQDVPAVPTLAEDGLGLADPGDGLQPQQSLTQEQRQEAVCVCACARVCARETFLLGAVVCVSIVEE